MKKRKVDFGVFNNNDNLVYLDYAATTFMPNVVVEEWVNFQKTIAVSLNRGSGILSELAQEEYCTSKKQILNFFSAGNDYEIALGKNATECLNLLAYTMGDCLKPGDIILMGPFEHHSNILPWRDIEKRKGACILQIPPTDDGRLDYTFLESIDISKIKIISISMISNVNSNLIDCEFFKRLRSHCGAKWILDVSQVVGHRTLDMRKIDADAYVMSAHKMYGPKNIGAAFIKKSYVEEMPPFLLGGGMVWNALGTELIWHKGDRKYQAGTFDVGLFKAWSRACQYLEEIGMENVMHNDRAVWKYVQMKLTNSFVSIVPGGDSDASICSFRVDKMHPHDLGLALSRRGIELRTGHMCAQDALNNLGVSSLCRVSWGIGSEEKDIDILVGALEEVVF
jgi:cysteine desulfurase